MPVLRTAAIEWAEIALYYKKKAEDAMNACRIAQQTTGDLLLRLHALGELPNATPAVRFRTRRNDLVVSGLPRVFEVRVGFVGAGEL